jgi:hypothetical protein
VYLLNLTFVFNDNFKLFYGFNISSLQELEAADKMLLLNHGRQKYDIKMPFGLSTPRPKVYADVKN